MERSKAEAADAKLQLKLHATEGSLVATEVARVPTGRAALLS